MIVLRFQQSHLEQDSGNDPRQARHYQKEPELSHRFAADKERRSQAARRIHRHAGDVNPENVVGNATLFSCWAAGSSSIPVVSQFQKLGEPVAYSVRGQTSTRSRPACQAGI